MARTRSLKFLSKEKESEMAKGQNTKKGSKKTAAKSLKEKRQDKKNKANDKKNSGLLIK